nr:AsmA family protein [Notoacmeibacter ruber]
MGGILVVVLAAAAILPPFIDWTDYRGRFEQQSSQLLGRPVSVDGQTSVRLLPFPSITFHDVTVTDEEGEPILVSETFSLDAELGPLLSGEFRIFDMRMDAPLLLLQAQPDGRVDWPFHMRIPEGLQQITVERLAISDGALFINRGEGRSEIRVDNVDAELSARSLAGPWRADGSALVAGIGTVDVGLSTGTQRPDGSVGISARVRPENYPASLVVEGGLTSENGFPRLDGNFRLRLSEPDEDDSDTAAAIRVNGTLQATPNSLISEELRFETGPTDAPYAATGSGRLDLSGEPVFAIRLEGDTLGGSLSGDDPAGELRGTIEDEEARFGRSSPVSLTEIREQILSFFATLPAPTIDGRLDLRLPAVIDGATTIRDLELAAEATDGQWQVNQLAADLPGRTRLEATGLLRTGENPGFDGRVVLAIRQPANFLDWFGVRRFETLATLSAAGFEADLSLDRQLTRFSDLELVVGPSRLTGSIERSEDGGALVAELQTDGLGESAIDLIAGLLGERLGAGQDVSSLTLNLTGGPLVYSGLTADRGTIRLRSGQDAVEIDELRLDNLAGSQIAGTGSVIAGETDSQPRFDLDLTILSDDLSDLTAALRGVPSLSRLARLGDKRLENAPSLGRDVRLDLSVLGASGDALDVTFEGESAVAEISGNGDLRTGEEGRPVRSGSLSLRTSGLRPVLAALGFEVLPLEADGRYALDASLDEEGALSGQLQGDDMAAQAELRLLEDGGAGGSFSIQANDILPITQLLGWAAPTDALSLPFSLSAEARQSGDTVQLSEMSGAVGDNAYSGAMRISAGEAVPEVDGEVWTDRFDLGDLVSRLVGEELPSIALPLSSEGEGTEALDEGSEGSIDGRADNAFAAPQSLPFHGTLALQSGEISLGQISAENASLVIEAASERLALREFSATRNGSAVSGAATLTRSGPSLLADLEIGVADVRLADISDGYLDGSVSFSSQLTGGGTDPARLVRSLSGSVTVTPSGDVVAVRGLATDILGQTLARADRLETERSQTNAPIDPTESIGPAVELARSALANGEAVELALQPSTWTVASGVARSPRLEWQVPGGSLTGTMAYAIPSNDINGDLRLVLDPIGETAMASLQPAIGIKLAGPPNAVSATIDTTILEQYLTLRAVEREQARLEELEKRIAEEAARRRAEAEERRRQQEEEARRRAEEERRQAEEEARRAAQEEARRAAEEEARRREQEAQSNEAERPGSEISTPDGNSGQTGSSGLDPAERLQLEELVPDLVPDG